MSHQPDKRNHNRTISTNNTMITSKINRTTPDHETYSATQTMKFQPQSQDQEQQSRAHLCITIRRGVRASARRHVNIPRGDLATALVDLVGGDERC